MFLRAAIGAYLTDILTSSPKDGDISFEKGYLIRVATAFASKRIELRPPKLNMVRLCDPAVVQHFEKID